MPNNEASGIRLLQLINAQALEIARREFKNMSKICLYNTGEYWVAFDHSAYFLDKIFPKSEFFVVHHPSYPMALVGISIPAAKLNHIVSPNSESDYLEQPITHSFVPQDYGDWHSKKVRNLSNYSYDKL